MTLHPQSQAFLDAMAAANGPNWPDMELGEARRAFDGLPFFGDPPEVGDVSDHQITGIAVRIYKPINAAVGDAAGRDLDAIVYFHGGGWVLGSIESHDVLCRRLANLSGAAVVSVDYRRPPEDPFPAAVEDCYTVCDVLSLDHASYGISNRMVVAGDSAGGNLCVAVGLMSRERGGPPLQGQVLIYPVLDGSMSGESYEQFAIGYGLTRDTMAWFWKNYTGDSESTSRSNPLASPMNAKDLSGLPAAHVLIAQYDVLKSECEIFAKRLVDAGVPTTTEHSAGMLHGFIHFAEPFDDALPATKEIAKRCRQFLDA